MVYDGKLKLQMHAFWFDNWAKQGTLYYVEDHDHGDDNIEVKEFIVTTQTWTLP